jgi:hypothetical protein
VSDDSKNGGRGKLPHAVFRAADQIEHLADAEHRKADIWEKCLELLTRLVDWIIKPKE